MNTNALRLLLIWTLVILTARDKTATVEPPVTSPPPPPTNTIPPTETATPTVDAAATQSAQQTVEAQATAEAEAAVETQAALDKAATSTEMAGIKLTATAGVEATIVALEAEFGRSSTSSKRKEK